MKKFWQSRTHWFSVIGLPAASYALLHINELGLSVVAAGWAGIGLTGLITVINMYLRQTTDTAIG